MTAHTRRLILVCNATVAAAANTAASRADTDESGQGNKTFTVGLSATGAAPASHYWANWQMRPAMALAIRTRLHEAGATAAEVTPVPAGETRPLPRFAVFDADAWTPEQVLVATGLKRVETAP